MLKKELPAKKFKCINPLTIESKLRPAITKQGI